MRDVNGVSPNSILGLTLVEGRHFTPRLTSGAMRTIINETMARQFWPGESARDRQTHRSSNRPRVAEIIGVVCDIRRDQRQSAAHAFSNVSATRARTFVLCRNHPSFLAAARVTQRRIAPHCHGNRCRPTRAGHSLGDPRHRAGSREFQAGRHPAERDSRLRGATGCGRHLRVIAGCRAAHPQIGIRLHCAQVRTSFASCRRRA